MQILSTKTLFSAITKNLKLETLDNLVTKYSYYLVTTINLVTSTGWDGVKDEIF